MSFQPVILTSPITLVARATLGLTAQILRMILLVRQPMDMFRDRDGRRLTVRVEDRSAVGDGAIRKGERAGGRGSVDSMVVWMGVSAFVVFGDGDRPNVEVGGRTVHPFSRLGERQRGGHMGATICIRTWQSFSKIPCCYQFEKKATNRTSGDGPL